MALEPPVAEGVEDNDAADAEAEACGVAAMPVETESPVVEDQPSDHRLTEVICKAHLAERGDPDKPFLRLGLVEQQVEKAEQHQKDHPPYETWTEVNSFLRLVVMLDIETQAEEHC